MNFFFSNFCIKVLNKNNTNENFDLDAFEDLRTLESIDSIGNTNVNNLKKHVSHKDRNNDEQALKSSLVLNNDSLQCENNRQEPVAVCSIHPNANEMHPSDPESQIVQDINWGKKSPQNSESTLMISSKDTEMRETITVDDDSCKKLFVEVL